MEGAGVTGISAMSRVVGLMSTVIVGNCWQGWGRVGDGVARATGTYMAGRMVS